MTQHAKPGGPTVEVLYFEGCPHHERAVALVRKALAAEKVSAPIQMIRVETDAEAHQHGFYGSPSVRFNGEDIAPPPHTATPGLACRVYRTPDGHMTPTPPFEAIVVALRRSMSGWRESSQPDARSECSE
ncbi:MAG: DF family (seleno)protein [Ktedonobacterales bacterium]